MPSFLDTYPKHSNDVIVFLRECTVEEDGCDSPAQWCIGRWTPGLGWYFNGAFIPTNLVEDWIEMVAWSDLKNLSVIKSENWSLRAGRDELLKQRDRYMRECERLNKILFNNLPRSEDDGEHAHYRHGEGAISDGPGTPGWPLPYPTDE